VAEDVRRRLAATAPWRRKNEQSARRRKLPRLRPGTWLWEQMRALLGGGHSPEKISGILRRMYPGDPERNVRL
jgi:hypothetical protein